MENWDEVVDYTQGDTAFEVDESEFEYIPYDTFELEPPDYEFGFDAFQY